MTGVDLAIASDVPVGAGLSSSAAIECATASALNEVWELGLDRVALARVGRRAENEAVGAPTGIMDQMASMLGETDAADLPRLPHPRGRGRRARLRRRPVSSCS